MLPTPFYGTGSVPRFREVFQGLSEHLSLKRADRVTQDTQRTDRAVDRANKAVDQMEKDSVLRRRLQLIERQRQERELEKQ